METISTIDDDLEKENFKFAMKHCLKYGLMSQSTNFLSLQNIWSSKNRKSSLIRWKTKDNIWYAQNLQTSQYFLQIFKWENWRCCKRLRRSYFTIMLVRFLPPPFPLSQFQKRQTTKIIRFYLLCVKGPTLQSLLPIFSLESLL